MNIEHLVAMANDIGGFFGGEPDRQSQVDGVRHHLHRFWPLRMRRQLAGYVRNGGDGLLDHVREAALGLDPGP